MVLPRHVLVPELRRDARHPRSQCQGSFVQLCACAPVQLCSTNQVRQGTGWVRACYGATGCGLPCQAAGSYLGRRNAATAFCPPKPKPLMIATSTAWRRATFGT